ncbi:MAG: type II secretion system protein [Candidatus Shapirobacteria bacterium]
MTNKGFTLFELLVTMAIIGILAAVIGGSFGNAQKKGRDARRIEDMKNIQIAMEQYYSFNNSAYPSWSADLVLGAGGQKVLEVWPIDPKNVAPYIYTWKNKSSASYCICALLENITAGNASDNDPVCVFANSSSYYCVKNQQ